MKKNDPNSSHTRRHYATGFLHKQVAALPGSFEKETIGFLHKNVSGANRGGVVAARV